MVNSTLCAITETWLQNDKDDLRYKEVPPLGYSILSHPWCDGRRGGGITVVHKKNLKVKDETPTQTSKIMEYMKVKACFSGVNFDVYVVYHFPGTSVISFCEELTNILENNITGNKGHLLLLGDINIHLDKQDASNTILFQDFLDSFGLINHVKQPMHTSSHILDLVISQPELCQTVRTVELGHYLSNHCFTHVSILVDRPIPARKNIKYWKIKPINQNAFNLHLSEAFKNQPETHIDRVLQYNRELRKVLQKHAPEKSKFIRDTHQQPWFSDEIKREIVLRRKMERIWIREKTAQAWNDFYTQHRQVANIIKEAQCNHYKLIIKEHKYDYKTIFNITNGILFRKQKSVLPPTESVSVLAENFSEFFQTKIDNITEKLQDKAADLDNRYIETNFQTNYTLTKFTLVLQSDVKEIIASAPVKSCELDPIPTSLLKMHIKVLAPIICNITNSSFDTGIFSDELKDALVHPLHKHHSLELELKKFRPVSNLPYLGKIIERLACRQIVKYTNSMGQMWKCQSAYQENFSTETALLKVKTDILDVIDKKEVMCLVMLYLSATFNTVNHHLLLKRLKYRFGVCDLALAWLESYLTNRTQRVVIQNEHGYTAQSAKKPLTQGIPQGSISRSYSFSPVCSPSGWGM